MAKYRILSLDGGGIRGLIPVILMQRLSAEPGLSNWLNQVDLIAGTSTGGLLALGIAKGLDLQKIRELYEQKGKMIFFHTLADEIFSLGTVISAKYDNKNLTREVRNILGNDTLGDLRKSVLITSFDLDNEDPDPQKRTWKPKLFHNIPGQGNDAGQLAYKVALYTSTAPTYFPTEDGYVDGGVFATNPSMCALAQTQDGRNNVRPLLSEVVVLSIGTGKNLTYIKGKNLDWGYAQWVRPLIFLMLDGVEGIADYQCRHILGRRYHRLAPIFPQGVNIQMDDASKIKEMTAFANSVPLDGIVAWLKAQWI